MDNVNSPAVAAELKLEIDSFRRSLLLRVDPDDVPGELSGLFAPLLSELKLQPPQVVADQLIEYTEREIAAIWARTQATWRERVVGAIGNDIDFRLRKEQLELEAYAAPPRGPGKARISLSLGAVFAIDDLALYALTSKSVLIPNRTALAIGDPAEDFDLPAPLAVAGARLQRDQRFCDYRGVLDAGVDRSILTFAMARAPWRLAQASIVSELALAWVVFHERAHWALGHLDLLEELGVSEIGLTEVPAGRRDTLGVAVNSSEAPESRRRSYVHRVLEGQADTQAFYLLCDYAMRKNGAADRYESLAASFGIPADPRMLRHLTYGACLRLCITAVSVACLAFHQARKLRLQHKRGTHPDPAARLLSMLANSLIVTPMCKQDATGEWIISVEDRTDEQGEDSDVFRDVTQDGLAMGLTDLMVISNGLGADFGPIIATNAALESWTVSEWLHDVTRFWVAEGDEQSPCRTAAGREVARLRRMDRFLLPHLDRLQERRFGRVLWLALGGIGKDRAAPG